MHACVPAGALVCELCTREFSNTFNIDVNPVNCHSHVCARFRWCVDHVYSACSGSVLHTVAWTWPPTVLNAFITFNLLHLHVIVCSWPPIDSNVVQMQNQISWLCTHSVYVKSTLNMSLNFPIITAVGCASCSSKVTCPPLNCKYRDVV